MVSSSSKRISRSAPQTRSRRRNRPKKSDRQRAKLGSLLHALCQVLKSDYLDTAGNLDVERVQKAMTGVHAFEVGLLTADFIPSWLVV